MKQETFWNPLSLEEIKQLNERDIEGHIFIINGSKAKGAMIGMPNKEKEIGFVFQEQGKYSLSSSYALSLKKVISHNYSLKRSEIK